MTAPANYNPTPPKHFPSLSLKRTRTDKTIFSLHSTHYAKILNSKFFHNSVSHWKHNHLYIKGTVGRGTSRLGWQVRNNIWVMCTYKCLFSSLKLLHVAFKTIEKISVLFCNIVLAIGDGEYFPISKKDELLEFQRKKFRTGLSIASEPSFDK